jgi:hypothetical protein
MNHRDRGHSPTHFSHSPRPAATPARTPASGGERAVGRHPGGSEDPTAATLRARIRARIHAAVRALPAAEQQSHGTAVAMLLHLLLRHTPEGHEPLGFVAGRRACITPAVLWAAGLLNYPVTPCTSDCSEPDHVTLITSPIDGGEEAVDDER